MSSPAHRRLRDQAARIEPTVDRVVQLPNGSRIGVAEFGERARMPIVYCHGFLGSRLEPGAVGRLRANIIAVDRPAYGHTDGQILPSLARWGADLRAALDLMGVERCVMVGASAGAPFALAAAAALGPRVSKVVLAGGVAGHEVVGTAGGTALVLALIGRHGSPAARVLQPLLRLAVSRGFDQALVRLAVASERRALERQGLVPQVLRRRLLQSLRTGHGLTRGGAMADARVLARPWDIDLAHVQSEVLVLHGADDPVVPPSHAHWYWAHLPHATLDIVPGELHFSLCFRSAKLIQDTARQLGRRQPVGETAPRPRRPEDASRP
jgi:pimeloyl-ACP methyl ester carboxylesterase